MDLLQDAIKKHTRPSSSGGNDSDDEFNPALSHAQNQPESSDSSRELFSQALQFLKSRKSSYQDTNSYDIDESHMVQSHQALYGNSGESASYYSGGDVGEHSSSYSSGGYHQSEGSGGHNDSSSLGAGAAMQALKMFTSGGGGGSGGGGSLDKNALIGMAMAQAGKLWEEKNNSAGGVSGDKQSAVNSAAELALKMYMKSQGGGLGGTGGPSGLMSLASKFLK